MFILLLILMDQLYLNQMIRKFLLIFLIFFNLTIYFLIIL